jgi:ubiquinone/menaquinone biosynthesis C-methylase UbiE
VTEERGRLGEALLLGTWLGTVAELYPAALLKDLGLYQPARRGVRPPLPDRPGAGVRSSRSHPLPVLTAETGTPADPRAEAFERLLRPLSAPVFEEALGVMRPYLVADSRVLDLYCGTGHTTLALAPLVPDGEVVAVEPEAGMLVDAFHLVRARGMGNAAFFQGTAEALPRDLDGPFDISFLPLSLPRYPDPPAAAAELFRVCSPDGYVFIVEASPGWYRRAGRILRTAVADDELAGAESDVGLPRPEAVESSFLDAGFAHYSWEELLPGVGLAVVMR